MTLMQTTCMVETGFAYMRNNMLANTEVVVKENALFANISKRNVSLPSNLNNGKVVANPVLLLFLANRDTGLFYVKIVSAYRCLFICRTQIQVSMLFVC